MGKVNIQHETMSGSFSPVFVRCVEEGFEIGHNFLKVIEIMISVHDLFYKTEKYMKDMSLRQELAE